MSQYLYGHPEFARGEPVPLEELRRLDRTAGAFENATVTGTGAAGADDLQVLAPLPRLAFWARVTGVGAGSNYSFKEVQDTSTTESTVQWADVAGGMTGTTNAREVNGNPDVPADPDTGAVVWVVQSEANEQWEFSFNGSNVPSPAPSINVRVYTADDTWAKPDGLTFVEVEVVGGGGGSGGFTTFSGTYGLSGGGGGGGYARGLIPAAALGATEAVTVGAGGAGGSSTPGSDNAATGDPGGASTFGSHVAATGGDGGAGAVSATLIPVVLGGTGGHGTAGTVQLYGGPGGQGYGFLAAASSFVEVAGSGGVSALNPAAQLPQTLTTNTSVGNTYNYLDGGGLSGAYGVGMGGIGRAVENSNLTVPGNDGVAGLVIVREYLHFG